jgi:drug/metabolite transporter (DMT)-like permease
LVLVAVVSSLKYMSSGLASLLFTLSPVLVAVLVHLFLKDEKLTWLKAVGVLVAFGGAGVLVLQGETELGDVAQADWRGHACAGVALIAGTTSWAHTHRYLRGADGVDVGGLRMFSACVALVPVVLLTGGYSLRRIDWGGLLALAYGGMVGGFAAFMADFCTLKRFGGYGKLHDHLHHPRRLNGAGHVASG